MVDDMEFSLVCFHETTIYRPTDRHDEREEKGEEAGIVCSRYDTMRDLKCHSKVRDEMKFALLEFGSDR